VFEFNLDVNDVCTIENSKKCRILKYTVDYSRASDFVNSCRTCKNWQKMAPVKSSQRNRRCLCHENLEHLSGKLRKLQDSVKRAQNSQNATYAYAKTRRRRQTSPRIAKMQYCIWTEMFTAGFSADIQHFCRGIEKQVRQLTSHDFCTDEAYVMLNFLHG
jgi:hypothetical protein